MKVVYSQGQEGHNASMFEMGREHVYEVPARSVAIKKALLSYQPHADGKEEKKEEKTENGNLVDGEADALKPQNNLFQFIEPRTYPLEVLESVHSSRFLHFLQNVHQKWVVDRPTMAVIPDVFAVQKLHRIPSHLPSQAGFFCTDRFTPIIKETWPAAYLSASSAITGADIILEGKEKYVYSLCRPPGHHAGREYYGGWCFLNNAALAATRLSKFDTSANTYSLGRKVAILDVDYHHGNGTQDIFYESGTVFYASIHADPEHGGEPYFTGYEAETGEGDGLGSNFNLPLPIMGITDDVFLECVDKALAFLLSKQPEYLVLSLGCDIMKDDLCGTWDVTFNGFSRLGQKIVGLNIPTLIVQEGGYNVSRLGQCVLAALLPFANSQHPQ